MASAWGDSFGTAWGDSWGAVAVPAPASQPAGGERLLGWYPSATKPKKRKKKKKKEELELEKSIFEAMERDRVEEEELVLLTMID